MTQCIYCRAEDANSLSHIVAEALGSNTTLRPGVCDDCNHIINKEVEEPIIKALSPIRSFFQLEGKRDKLPRMDIEVRYGGGRQKISAHSTAEVLKKVFVFTNFTDPNGTHRDIAFLSFDQDALAPHSKRYFERHPKIAPSEFTEDMTALQFWTSFDFDVFADPRCLRMVAKIAFEWWCMERSPAFVLSAEYDEIRQYIRYGTEPNYPIVSVIENATIQAYFEQIPFGPHLIYRSVNRRLDGLVMLFSPYSLVFYKIIVTRRYRALASDRKLTTINPQTGDPYSPVITTLRALNLTLMPNVPSASRNALDVIRRLSPRLLIRLNNGMTSIIQNSAI